LLEQTNVAAQAMAAGELSVTGMIVALSRCAGASFTDPGWQPAPSPGISLFQCQAIDRMAAIDGTDRLLRALSIGRLGAWPGWSRNNNPGKRMTMERELQAGVMTGISLLLPITLATMAVVLLAPVLPRLMVEYAQVPGHDYLVPMVLTLPALCVALLCPLAGLLGDRFGRRRLLLFAFLLYAAVGMAPLVLIDLRAILVSRVGVGIAEALIYVLSTTMISDHFTGAARDRWLAWQTAFASLSALLFFALGGLLGGFGWRVPFWVYGSVLVWRYTSEHPANVSGQQPDQAPQPMTAPTKVRFAFIVAITVVAAVLFYTVQIQGSVGLTHLGLTSPARIGVLTALASLGVPLGTLVYARVAGQGPARLLCAEFAMLAVGFLLMGYSRAVSMFLAGSFINQLGGGMLLPTLLVWAINLLPYQVRARGTGLWQSSFALGQWLSTLAVTTLSLRFGGLMATFALLGYVALACMGIAAVALLLFRRRPDRAFAAC
jgi:MFS family permease